MTHGFKKGMFGIEEREQLKQKIAYIIANTRHHNFSDLEIAQMVMKDIEK